MKIKDYISDSIHNIKSVHTKRKLVVFQSDDWGALRTPSKDVYNKLIKRGLPLDKDVYSRNEALENKKDLERLFEVLTSVKDKNGNHPVFTANYVVANPDFEKIKEDSFQNYYYESIEDTFRKQQGENLINTICSEGIREGIWFPQSHGREHLNVNLWMNALRDNIPEVRLAFDHGMFAVSKSLVRYGNPNFLAAFNAKSEQEEVEYETIIREGLLSFKDIFKYESESFISPNYIWGIKLERELMKYNVCMLQCGKVQRLPEIYNHKIARHYTGNSNVNQQIYICRNCDFEPTTSRSLDIVNKCMMQIKNAFFWNAPVIINTHRINYIGSINQDNIDVNLQKLKELLNYMIIRWPDIEFVTTSDLKMHLNL